MKAIVRENIGINKIEQDYLKQEIKCVLQAKTKNFDENLFNTKLETVYGKMRSVSEHGQIDLKDETRLEKARTLAEDATQWAHELIDEYINKNHNWK